MTRKTHPIWILFLFLPGFVYAGVKNEQNLNQIMTDIASEMSLTYPMIVNQQKLSPQDIKLLRTKTKDIVTLFEQAKPYINQKSNTYQISYDLVLNHLNKTQKSLLNANSIASRKHLRSLGAICVSCHTQDTQLRTIYNGIARDKFNSDLAFAEFSYMTRDYNNAVKYYDKYLRSDSVKSELDLIKPIQRILTIHTQVFHSPGIAAKQLTEYKQLAAHTKKTQTHLTGWIEGLKKLRLNHKVKPENITFKALEAYVNEYIGNTDQAGAEFFSSPEDEVSRVWLRGALFHYLNDNPSADQIPKILYWLSICDRTLGYSFSISFADLYLKECIVKYSSHDYAKKCYKEYEEFVAVSYSGSGGAFIPQELENELFELKKHLK